MRLAPKTAFRLALPRRAQRPQQPQRAQRSQQFQRANSPNGPNKANRPDGLNGPHGLNGPVKVKVTAALSDRIRAALSDRTWTARSDRRGWGRPGGSPANEDPPWCPGPNVPAGLRLGHCHDSWRAPSQTKVPLFCPFLQNQLNPSCTRKPTHSKLTGCTPKMRSLLRESKCVVCFFVPHGSQQIHS